MRKLAFTDSNHETKKLMIYESTEGTYLFGYDSLLESSAIWDQWFETIEEVEEHCELTFNIEKGHWIEISDPIENCQHDFIMPTRIKGKEIGKPEFGNFQTCIDSVWVDKLETEKFINFNGFTGNERLLFSGLLHEFETSKIDNKTKAIRILKALKFDDKSIEQIL